VKHVDISAGKATFVNTKSNENRTVYFTEPLKGNVRVLIEGRKPDDRVFRNSMDKQIHTTEYSKDLKKRAILAGVTKRAFPHNFRHSYITHMIEAGVPIVEVAMLVGDKDICTTYSTYMHLADKTLHDAAMRHPMVRRYVDTTAIIKSVKETIERFHLESDKHFFFTITDSGDGRKFELATKNSNNQ